jgi:predicted HTH transcriptional regulator
MIQKNLDEITENDLQGLIDNSVQESKIVEYKRIQPGNSDSDKKEFLSDVSSFANSSGGDLIFGIIAEKGVPKKLEGLEIENVDQEIGRLDSIIRDGIEPRIPSSLFSIKPIALSNSKKALIIRIFKSWISPHRVSYKGHDRFYGRSSNGKYPLDVAELRIAFNMPEALAKGIRQFRETE